GTHTGVYTSITTGQPSALPGSPLTSAAFASPTAAIHLPGLWPTTGQHSVGMWFKTSTALGVLVGYSNSPITAQTTTDTFTPALYIGSSGKLYGEFWNGAYNPIATTGTVADGKWHYAVLSADNTSQTLYLDGAAVGSRTGVIKAQPLVYQYAGTGFLG